MTEQEWRDQVMQASEEKVHATQPELMGTAETIVKKYGVNRMQLDVIEATQIAMALNEIQEHAFLLGMRIGMQLLMDALKKQGPKKEESEAQR